MTRSPARWLIDLVVVALLLLVGMVGFLPAYGTSRTLLVGAAAILVGLGLALAGAWWRWSSLVLSGAVVLTYLLLAGPVVVPSTTIGGVLPGLRTLTALAGAAVQVWMDVLTAEPPLGDRPWMLAAPLILGLVSAVLAGTAALRARHAWWALPPAALLLVAAIALGTHEVVLPLAQGTAFALLSVVWVAWRSTSAHQTVPGEMSVELSDGATSGHRVRAARAGVMIAVAAVLGLLATPVLAGGETPRTVARDRIEPPLDLRDYASPLAAFRMYVKDRADDVLLTVSELPADGRVRLAVLDGYDGMVYNAASAGSTPFVRIGRVVDDRPAEASTTQVTVRVEGYRGVWLPVVGQVREVEVDESADNLAENLHHSPTGDVLLSPTGVSEGDSWVLTTVPHAPITAADLRGVPFMQVSVPELQGAPDSAASYAAELVGDADGPVAQIQALQEGLSGSGYFSNGLEGETPSRAGHTTERINALLTADQMVGDDEQYAVAMALMARSLGAPARVVMGFYPEEPVSGEVALTGSDVHAWVEVAFEGVGWVPFDPTPAPDQVVQEQIPEPQTAPRPQAMDPPPPPEDPAELPDPPVTDDSEAEAEDELEEESSALNWWWVLAAGIPILLLLLPLAVVIAVKTARSRRRARSRRPADRISGGWSEVMDTALDLGVSVPRSATRREGARVLAGELAGDRAVALAERADAGTFDAREPTEEEIRDFWVEVDAVRRDLSGSVGSWSRFRARVSLASLRRTRPTGGDSP